MYVGTKFSQTLSKRCHSAYNDNMQITNEALTIAHRWQHFSATVSAFFRPIQVLFYPKFPYMEVFDAIAVCKQRVWWPNTLLLHEALFVLEQLLAPGVASDNRGPSRFPAGILRPFLR